MKKNQPIRMLDQVVPWVEQAFSLHGYGERIVWEIVFGIVQHPQGMAPIFTLLSTIPGPRLDSGPHIDIAQVAALGITEEICDDTVRGAMARMLEARSKALAQALAPGNGAPPPAKRSAGGIVLP